MLKLVCIIVSAVRSVRRNNIMYLCMYLLAVREERIGCMYEGGKNVSDGRCVSACR